MSNGDVNEKELIAKYSFLLNLGVGFFNKKTRARLMGRAGLSGRDRTINDFWYDVR